MKLLEKERLLVKINEELAYRRKITPLDFHKPLDLQARFEVDPFKKKGLFGGNRSGKSEEGARYVIQKALSKPKQRIWAVGCTFQDSIAIQQRKIWELCPKNRIKYGKHNEITGFTNRKLLFDNGTLITFKSYDQGVEPFQSDDIDLVWLDEEPPADVYGEILMRLLDRDGEIILTMTSTQGITDLIGDIFEDHDVLESQYAPLVDEVLPRVAVKGDFKFYFLWTPENPYINKERVLNEAKLLTRQEKKSRMYGIPINLSGKIYPAFNKDVHVISFDDLPDSKYTLYHVLDPHDRKPWAMAWFAVHPTGTCYTVDEYPNRNFNEMLTDDKTYDEYVELIKNKEKVIEDVFGCKVFKRIIDPNFGNKTVQLAERQGGQAKTTPVKELKSRGLIFHDGIDAVEAGHLKVREYLHYETKGNEIVVQPKWLICDHCENMIRHHSRYSRKDIETSDGDIKNNVKPKEKYKDFPDLGRYFFMSDPRHVVVKQFKADGRKVY